MTTNGTAHPFPLKPPVEMPPRPEPTRHLVIEVRDGDVVLGTEEPTVEDVAAWSQKPAPRACVKHATRGRPDMSCLACNVLSEPPRGDVELVFGFACVPNEQLLAECQRRGLTEKFHFVGRDEPAVDGVSFSDVVGIRELPTFTTGPTPSKLSVLHISGQPPIHVTSEEHYRELFGSPSGGMFDGTGAAISLVPAAPEAEPHDTEPPPTNVENAYEVIGADYGRFVDETIREVVKGMLPSERIAEISEARLARQREALAGELVPIGHRWEHPLTPGDIVEFLNERLGRE
jgi:hypothetical protein